MYKKNSISEQFEKPGRRNDFDYPQMVKESVTKALADANIKYTEIDQAVCGYVFGLYYPIEFASSMSS